MCKVLQVSGSTYYYESKQKTDESELTASIIAIFKAGRNSYGTRKIKQELSKKGMIVSCRIVRIMKQEGLVSAYTAAQFHPQKDTCNESEIADAVNRKFDEQPYRNAAASDLTYVRAGMNRNCICVLADLFNREITGYSAGPHKTAALVRQAFMTVKGSLEKISIFHTDRGNEFRNQLIEETLETFSVTRSFSHKRCPYDNAAAEAAFKIIKTESVQNQTFANLDVLKLQPADYVNWFNNHRIHSSPGYLTPVEYRMNNRKKVV